MPRASFQIRHVSQAGDLTATLELFQAYALSLEVDLSYQDFAAEMAAKPGKYAPPSGGLLLARDNDEQPVGCVGLRPPPIDGCCEMKRLYVSPRGRGLGPGKALMNAIVKEAKLIGYREIRLDTLPTMTEAISLYKKAGFVSIAPYYETPVVGTLFLAKRLVV